MRGVPLGPMNFGFVPQRCFANDSKRPEADIRKKVSRPRARAEGGRPGDPAPRGPASER
ncbi:hypothetical protein VARIO8X_110152 [Burkholderiales bacterium 8X]|nr:hypothetical protein VARIO8X_110152 [Burkholderiales bacterium 8X]